jgi:sigma-B regulation protein RsbU (phosphoserine phosphatase)
MVKLPDKLEVVARVRYHSRGFINLLERNEAYHKLAESQKELAAEVRQAARYVKSLLPPPLSTGPVIIEWKFVPSTQLAGDMFGYHWIDPEHMALFLLDVSGHGVGSALLAVSAGNMLTAQSLPGVDPRNPGAVVTKLNNVFQMDRQDGKYFTIWYGVYRPTDRTLAYCNAGHPPAFLWTNHTLTELAVDGPAVGMMPELPYETHNTVLPPDARMLVFSDGSFEIEKTNGEMWPYSDFVAHMAALLNGTSPLDMHLEFVRTLHGQDTLADDFSMMDIRFPVVAPAEKSPPRRKKKPDAAPVANGD